MSREAFLARVREAAQAGQRFRVHVNEPADSEVGYVGAGPDPVDHLAAEIIAVGGQAYMVDTPQQAVEQLTLLLKQFQPRTALCWQHPLLESLSLMSVLKSLTIEPLDYERLATLAPAEQRPRMLAADIGITSAKYAIAETGTLVMQSGPGRERLASLLPPVHVAIVDSSQILPDLFDLFALLEASGVAALASNLVLITGPSKTGDIELKLTTGVHGPGEWHVVIIREVVHHAAD
jgi:L-lactate dehydrogenase complex protein LldG